ncbi:hypothetical protein SAMN05444126_11336 [Salisediminibacterium halotolerans]|uniref:Uncharacterized protein n=1 Tax=Salisediminibacterium halotolerans TaxID=517425 RepID=A0A1H9U8K7_9BACI|nr:hypothetical protein SAMN05444126_11336 [Salisediminibacterium haloalkalitolerans]
MKFSISSTTDGNKKRLKRKRKKADRGKRMPGAYMSTNNSLLYWEKHVANGGFSDEKITLNV